MAREEFNRPPSLPPYAEMIFAAIDALKEKEGSSESSISTYIESTCGYLPDEHINILTDNLSKLLDNGELVVLNGNYMRSEGATPAKRGRGRPPKAGAESRVSSPAPATGSAEPGSEVKRGRGRPKKNPYAPSTPKKVKVSGESSGRGRGRPRKVQPELAGVEAN